MAGIGGLALEGLSHQPCCNFFYLLSRSEFAPSVVLPSGEGFICDNVINYKVVLASGETVNANANSHADLWTALKDCVEKMKQDVASRGQLVPYVYMNYAWTHQDPIGSYGVVNKKKLQQAGKKYDLKACSRRLALAASRFSLEILAW
ncbi:hypothetical protein M406DRAFT_330766 [Cryphonectria parasitica EP155]|uniref:Uncharacterized protein n=1 Tax=Cryphonectria parasitica (strain ATCC 38755 / EP155) TaxID=660469 RepID=A0A9P4Y105_CRYP1|nr:uncharacterized protein M406DRAFT_330766 [Cryphonectria parasitica EP155]KAF3764425.1 hypothetical protein M406DRAFT_330766 [Cryphonectria parasitica EP155]